MFVDGQSQTAGQVSSVRQKACAGGRSIGCGKPIYEPIKLLRQEKDRCSRDAFPRPTVEHFRAHYPPNRLQPFARQADPEYPFARLVAWHRSGGLNFTVLPDVRPLKEGALLRLRRGGTTTGFAERLALLIVNRVDGQRKPPDARFESFR